MFRADVNSDFILHHGNTRLEATRELLEHNALGGGVCFYDFFLENEIVLYDTSF